MFPDHYVFSQDMTYRYEFRRRLKETTDPDLDNVVWILLNPGTGDTDGKPRPTLARCIKWSRAWGYASLTIVNLFALRATDPKALRSADDPIGPDNDDTIRRVTRDATRVIVAWGKPRKADGQRQAGRCDASRTPLPRCHETGRAEAPVVRAEGLYASILRARLAAPIGTRPC